MIRNLFVLVVTVMVVVHTASAAPGHRGPTSEVRADITGLIDAKLQEILASVSEPILPSGPIEIRINQDFVAHVYLRMDDCKLLGVTDFAAHNCALNLDSATRGNISISIRSPKVTLNTDHYFMNGSVVDHVELFGEGPGMIYVDEMDIKVEGSANVTLKPFTAVFDTAVLDLEMWRWTVNLEDLMPGTDLGTVFNEFFTMYGPEIFDIMENNINKSGKLLIFLNSLFPPTFQ